MVYYQTGSKILAGKNVYSSPLWDSSNQGTSLTFKLEMYKFLCYITCISNIFPHATYVVPSHSWLLGDS